MSMSIVRWIKRPAEQADGAPFPWLGGVGGGGCVMHGLRSILCQRHQRCIAARCCCIDRQCALVRKAE